MHLTFLNIKNGSPVPPIRNPENVDNLEGPPNAAPFPVALKSSSSPSLHCTSPLFVSVCPGLDAVSSSTSNMFVPDCCNVTLLMKNKYYLSMTNIVSVKWL